MNFFTLVTVKCLEGFYLTVLLFAITLVMAIPLGLIISFCSMSKFKPLKWLTKGFIWVIRGTPLMLQVIVVSFIPSKLFMTMNKDLAAFLNVNMGSLNFIFVCAAFIINYAAYFSEIFRGGIEGIPRGQFEAGQVLGMTKAQIFFKIILMQVVKRIMPPMSNEIITLVKDTALARVLGVAELILVVGNLTNVYGIVWPLIYAGAFYLVFNGILTIVLGYIEKKLDYYKV